MKKTLTKEQLAAQLDGIEYRDSISEEIWEAAKQNNLVIVHGASDDLIELIGAITEELGIDPVIRLTKKGVPESDCEDENCPYFQRWMTTALKRGEVREVRVFWGGESGNKTMDAAKYAELGKPTWCFETEMPHACFDMFDTYGDDREFFCRGIVIDLDEWFSLNYTQIVMNGG